MTYYVFGDFRIEEGSKKTVIGKILETLEVSMLYSRMKRINMFGWFIVEEDPKKKERGKFKIEHGME